MSTGYQIVWQQWWSFYFYLLVSAIVVIVTAIKTKDIVSEIDINVREIDYEENTPKINKVKIA